MKESLYEPDMCRRVEYSQCNTCKNKQCAWYKDEIIKLYNCKNRKD